MTIEIVEVPPDTLDGERDTIVGIYRAAFAGPPYYEDEEHVQGFRWSLNRHKRRPGFRCLLARYNGKATGFAYGATCRPGDWWRDCVAAGLQPEQVACWLEDAFELIELAVLPAEQGKGIGGRLHDALLAGVPHRMALLSTHHSETPAMHLYRRRGWVVLNAPFFFPGIAIPYAIMGLELP